MAYAPMYELWTRTEGEDRFDLVLDLGHAEDYPRSDMPWFFGVRLPLTDQQEDGLPGPEEHERLTHVENRVREQVRGRDGLYVGRRTGAGARDLLFYLPSRPRGIEDRLRMTIGSHLMFISRADPQWIGYESLLPQPRELRQMEDRRLLQDYLDAGVEEGMDVIVMHRVLTSSPKGAAALVGLFEKLGLAENEYFGERPEITVIGFQQTLFELEPIHKVAWVLESKSPKARGEYEGWSVSG